VHTFLIRHPRETILSRHALDPAAGRDAYGFKSQHEIFTAICRLTGQVPAVIDAGDLLTRPAAIIRAYCAQAGIDFRPAALTWQPSDRPEWQPSRRWHAEAAASTGFTHPDSRQGRRSAGTRSRARQLPQLSPAVLRKAPRTTTDSVKQHEQQGSATRGMSVHSVTERM
jgi:Sulfotransferase domain